VPAVFDGGRLCWSMTIINDVVGVSAAFIGLISISNIYLHGGLSSMFTGQA